LKGPPPTIWKRVKRPKFGAIFDNCRLWWLISPAESVDKMKIRKASDQRWAKKLVKFGPQKSYSHANGHFSGDNISTRDAASLNFYTRYNP